MSTQNKQQIILGLIREGNATDESLMAAANVNKAGLSSQLAYLNARGRAMAEVDESRAEFPIKGSDGVYFVGNITDFNAKLSKTSGVGVSKVISVAEAIEFATKREAKAATAVDKALTKMNGGDPHGINDLVLQARKLELTRASIMLNLVENGDYSCETFTVSDTVDATCEESNEQVDELI